MLRSLRNSQAIVAVAGQATLQPRRQFTTTPLLHAQKKQTVEREILMRALRLKHNHNKHHKKSRPSFSRRKEPMLTRSQQKVAKRILRFEGFESQNELLKALTSFALKIPGVRSLAEEHTEREAAGKNRSTVPAHRVPLEDSDSKFHSLCNVDAPTPLNESNATNDTTQPAVESDRLMCTMLEDDMSRNMCFRLGWSRGGKLPVQFSCALQTQTMDHHARIASMRAARENRQPGPPDVRAGNAMVQEVVVDDETQKDTVVTIAHHDNISVCVSPPSEESAAVNWTKENAVTIGRLQRVWQELESETRDIRRAIKLAQRKKTKSPITATRSRSLKKRTPSTPARRPHDTVFDLVDLRTTLQMLRDFEAAAKSVKKKLQLPKSFSNSRKSRGQRTPSGRQAGPVRPLQGRDAVKRIAQHQRKLRRAIADVNDLRIRQADAVLIEPAPPRRLSRSEAAVTIAEAPEATPVSEWRRIDPETFTPTVTLQQKIDQETSGADGELVNQADNLEHNGGGNHRITMPHQCPFNIVLAIPENGRYGNYKRASDIPIKKRNEPDVPPSHGPRTGLPFMLQPQLVPPFPVAEIDLTDRDPQYFVFESEEAEAQQHAATTHNVEEVVFEENDGDTDDFVLSTAGVQLHSIDQTTGEIVELTDEMNLDNIVKHPAPKLTKRSRRKDVLGMKIYVFERGSLPRVFDRKGWEMTKYYDEELRRLGRKPAPGQGLGDDVDTAFVPRGGGIFHQ